MFEMSWKRTWSLPRPVAPWARTVRPFFFTSGRMPAVVAWRPKPVTFQ